MSNLPSNYEDIFINDTIKSDLEELDYKYEKFLNCNIYSNDGKTFLGVINFNKYDPKSLANKYGTYGSQYSPQSLFNKYGIYGSQYNSQSPFNKYSNTPPVIVDKNGKVVGKLTTNKYVGNKVEIINAIEFFNWFNYKLGR